MTMGIAELFVMSPLNLGSLDEVSRTTTLHDTEIDLKTRNSTINNHEIG